MRRLIVRVFRMDFVSTQATWIQIEHSNHNVNMLGIPTLMSFKIPLCSSSRGTSGDWKSPWVGLKHILLKRSWLEHYRVIYIATNYIGPATLLCIVVVVITIIAIPVARAIPIKIASIEPKHQVEVGIMYIYIYIHVLYTMWI